MQEMQDISLVVFQSAVIVSLLFLAVGLAKPNWFIGWMRRPRPVYIFYVGVLLFLISFTGLGLKVGDELPEAVIKALVLFSVLFLIVGLINPAWVFGSEKADRFWVMSASAILFMGFMTLLGPYLKASREERQLQQQQAEPSSPESIQPSLPASQQAGAEKPTSATE